MTNEQGRTKNSIHVARAIVDRTTGFEPFLGSMTDEIVAGSFKRNRDGSITINCQISVKDNATGEYWAIDARSIRLSKQR